MRFLGRAGHLLEGRRDTGHREVNNGSPSKCDSLAIHIRLHGN